MTPLRASRMRLRYASGWLRATLDRVSRQFGTSIDLRPDGELTLRLPCAKRP
jgi:poly-gamma-glutamate synthesis protein (capsule biosynthesis protein)